MHGSNCCWVCAMMGSGAALVQSEKLINPTKVNSPNLSSKRKPGDCCKSTISPER